MIRDLRFAARTLLKSRGPSTIAILVLALGFAANTTVFSLFNGLVLEPLGFEEPDRLVRIFGTEAAQGRDRQRISEAAVQSLRHEARGFDQVAAARNMGLSVTDSERPLNPLMRQVSSGWFDLFGVDPLLGRVFAPEDHLQGGRLALLHHDFWQSYFGGDPDIIGRTIELADEPYVIIGVMPDSFRNEAFPNTPVLWLPMAPSAEPDPRNRNHVLLARLGESTTVPQAQEELGRISAHLTSLYPETHTSRGMRVTTLHQSLVERFKPALMVLLAAVSFVLMIACANVANLLLTRALGRRQEIAVRQALGASRLHLARQLVAESFLISMAGAGLGLLVTWWGLGPLTRLAPSTLSVPLIDRVQIEPRVVLFTLLLAGLTAIFFGLLPLRQLYRNNAEKLSAGAVRAAGSRSRQRLRAALVVAELALSMVLLVGAGLTVRSLAHLRSLELGFESDDLLVGRVGARGPGFESRDSWAPFHRQVMDRVAALPGVDAVGGIEFLPTFAGGFGFSTAVVPQGSDLPPDSRPQATVLSVLPGYFDTAGQPLLGGRDVSYHDAAEGEAVAVISRNLARLLWNDEAPGREQAVVGRTLLVGEGDQVARVKVVGIAGDLRGPANAPESPLILYRPHAQRPTLNLSIYVRAHGAGEGRLLGLVPEIEREVWTLSRDAPVYSFNTMAQLLHDIEWQPRFVVQLLSGFALLALLLAATGIYAVLAYAVSERTREIGIRVAVGAGRGEILAMVGRDALRLSAIGVGLGTLVALAASRGLESQLLGVTARDPSTYAFLAIGLTAIGMLASFVPAWRATRVDPVVALRSE